MQAAFETDAKYRYMQDQQKTFNKGELLPLLPNSTKPKLPAPPPLPPPGTGEVDPRVLQEKLRQGQGDSTSKQQPAQVPPPESALPTNPPAPVQPQGAPSPQATPAPQPEGRHRLADR